MRYHYQKPRIYLSVHGEMHLCAHPLYSRCTLYCTDGIGLAVIQQRFDPAGKTTWWSEIDPWLTDMIYLHPRFAEYFGERAETATDGLYPTVTIRQLMWALKMKPLARERWETVFDRREL